MTELRQLAGLNSASNTTTQFNSTFSFYLPLGKSIILTDRFGGGYTWGNFEFYHAQFLGSAGNALDIFAARATFSEAVSRRTNSVWWRIADQDGKAAGVLSPDQFEASRAYAVQHGFGSVAAPISPQPFDGLLSFLQIARKVVNPVNEGILRRVVAVFHDS